jgi:hypothetical protein
MMSRFVFINDQAFIDKMLEVATEEDLRRCTMKVSRGEFFKDNGYLVYEPWITSLPILKAKFDDTKTQNEYDTGDPNVSYDDLCKYQAEFEERHGKCDGFAMDTDVMQYELAKVQYCIDRSHGLIM